MVIMIYISFTFPLKKGRAPTLSVKSTLAVALLMIQDLLEILLTIKILKKKLIK